MDNRPIGVFDSGLGGLTAFCELKRILPNEDIIYFGDTSRVPYGTRSVETIHRYVSQDIAFLKSQNVKMVIAACNTATTVITENDIANMGVIFAGVLTPAVTAALKATKTKNIGVIGTSATIDSGAYEQQFKKQDSTVSIHGVACPLFVPLVENGFTSVDDEVTIIVAEKYLKPLKEKNIDTLILGCTHFPIISEVIKIVMGENVTLIDSGKEVAQTAAKLLLQNDAQNLNKMSPQYKFFVSDTVLHFEKNAKLILKSTIPGTVEKVNIENVAID